MGAFVRQAGSSAGLYLEDKPSQAPQRRPSQPTVDGLRTPTQHQASPGGGWGTPWHGLLGASWGALSTDDMVKMTERVATLEGRGRH